MQLKFRGLKDGKLVYWNMFNIVEGVDTNTISMYTGVNDCNGNPIYWGDILDMTPGANETEKIYDTIVFAVGCSCLKKARRYYELTNGIGEGIVIGNIRENKEFAEKEGLL